MAEEVYNMNGRKINGITPGGKRAVLAEFLPLKTPFLIQIFPVYACNFKCGYCLYALPKEEHGYVSDKIFMDLNTYKKCIDDISKFESQLKMLRFAGIGEPLLHKNIADMVKYAKEKEIAQSIDIVTNGALLNKELSLKLIDSGLDRLRISIQGVSKERYKSLSNVDLDFQNLINNIEFFYKNKGNTKVYIKIIDCAFSHESEQQLFYDMFGEICDIIAVEHLTPTVEGIDYTKLSKDALTKFSQSGNPILESNICPQPFYMMQINPDGNVVPCCSMKYPWVMGNIQNEGICDIWNGKAFSHFRRILLDGVKAAGEVCSKCSLYKYGLFEEDKLDEYVENLKKVYQV